MFKLFLEDGKWNKLEYIKRKVDYYMSLTPKWVIPSGTNVTMPLPGGLNVIEYRGEPPTKAGRIEAMQRLIEKGILSPEDLKGVL